MTVLLMGHPNVGKSAVFNRLTGANITESNYPGTTVDFTKGHARIDGEEARIIDVPGTFSTEPKDEAEKVAMEIMEEHGDATVVAVLDATKIERGLYLVLEILEKGYPVAIALNMWDDARKREIRIDVEEMEELLGLPIVPTVAISGKGISELASRISEAKAPDLRELEARIEEL